MTMLCGVVAHPVVQRIEPPGLVTPAQVKLKYANMHTVLLIIQGFVTIKG